MSAKTNTKARYIRFKTTFELSNMGIRVLRSHARGQNHLHLSKKITDFLSSTNKPSTTETSSTKSLNSATCSRKHPTLEVSFVTAQETLAEIRWAIEFSMYFFV